METNPIRMCELLVGLPDVDVLGIDDEDGEPIRVHVESRVRRPACPVCAGPMWVKDRPRVELVDLAAFGRSARPVWHKHRWWCPADGCPQGSWTAEDVRIASPRFGMTARAGRWVTFQVGRHGRTVAEVARELDCDWHTVNDTVLAYGQALLDADTDRIGQATALGLDGTLFCRIGRLRTQAWATSVVDVGAGTLLDMVEGRNSTGVIDWIEAMPEDWRALVRYGVLDPGPGPERRDSVHAHPRPLTALPSRYWRPRCSPSLLTRGSFHARERERLVPDCER